MALIKCPECGKEISDKAISCPNCAYPMTEILKRVDVGGSSDISEKNDLLNESITNRQPAMEYNDSLNSSYNNNQTQTGNFVVKNTKKYVIIAASVILLVLIAAVTLGIHRSNVKKAEEEQRLLEEEQRQLEEKQNAYDSAVKKYSRGEYEDAQTEFENLGDFSDASVFVSLCEAQILCNSGKYRNAYDEISDINNFKEATELKRQIYYETRFFEGVVDMRQYFKNPDSLAVNDVEVLYVPDAKNDNPIAQPAFIMKISGQNGFGGYTASYGISTEYEGKYTFLGSCDTLDEDDYKSSEADEKLIAQLINAYKEKGVELTDAINYERITSIIESGNYTNISRIDELKYEMIEGYEDSSSEEATTEE